MLDGVILLDEELLRDSKKIFGQVVCSFRYGREEDEVMGLNFQKDLYLCSEQIYPKTKSESNNSKLQDRLLKKLGPNAFPFTFQLPTSAPGSVTLQPGAEDQGEPCGVNYYVKVFAGENESDRTNKKYFNQNIHIM
jgi:arrestin-1